MPEFTEERQPSNRRGKSNKNRVLDGIKAAIPTCSDREEAEELYFKYVAIRAFNSEDKDSSTLLKLLGDKAWASIKPSAATVEFDFPINGTLMEKAISIINAMASGAMPPDTGRMMIDAIKDYVIIEQGTDLKERLEEIEKQLGLVNV